MLIVNINGHVLTDQEKQLLQHPFVAGVILFKHNYASLDQLTALTEAILDVNEHALISIDHEGGRVQRLGPPFTTIPPMHTFGEEYDTSPELALQKVEQCAYTMASELKMAGIDCNFAPVLDVFADHSQIIRDRAFHRDPEAITHLARAFIKGAQRAGMLAIGKHFPGHGVVTLDSHVDCPVDDRSLEALQQRDMLPFENLIREGALDGVMMSHVVYSKVDDAPAGFSSYWIHDVLRGQLGFQGLVFSDDLFMKAATIAGDISARIIRAKEAGCDVMIVGQDQAALLDALEKNDWKPSDDTKRLLKAFTYHALRQVEDDKMEW